MNKRNHAFVSVIAVVLSVTGCATTRPRTNHTNRFNAAPVEIGCATCMFKMRNVTGCKLALKIDGRPYLVSGSGIDDHGDAHAANGLCNAIRTATATGRIVDGRFAASQIALDP